MSFTLWLSDSLIRPSQSSGLAPMPISKRRAAVFRRAYRPSLETLEDRLCLSAAPVSGSMVRPDAATQAHVSAAYGQLPLSFEANSGQTDSQVNFLSRGSGYTLFLAPDEAVLSLATGATNDVVRMHILGANSNAHSTGMDLQAGRTNYLVGSDPSSGTPMSPTTERWSTRMCTQASTSSTMATSATRIRFRGRPRRPTRTSIRLAFDGVQSMKLDAGGNLILHTAGGDLVKDAPVVYQEINGVRHTIASRYLLEGGQVRFEVGSYDHALPLVIDPILSYSSYLGGSGNDFGL